MALHHLLSLIPGELSDRYRSVLARWTDTSPEGEWAQEPGYGAFVDGDGRVVTGASPARAILDSDNPRSMELVPEAAAALPRGCRVVFLDWGRQPLSWEEIFELWEAWESQGMVAGCGSVSLAWALCDHWIFPGWIAFREDFDGAPLAVVSTAAPSGAPEVPTSFLARALKIRGEVPAASAGTSGGAPWSAEELPMLPFTLDALADPSHPWPAGVP